MRVRVATTVLGITAALLAVPACSTGTKPGTTDSVRTRKPTAAARTAAVLSSAALKTRLLDQSASAAVTGANRSAPPGTTTSPSSAVRP